MERSAFEQKARTWREKALNVSRHYGAGEDMAEDIAQDVMLRLWQMHDELEGLYHPYVNFGRVQEIGEGIISEILPFT